MAIPRYVEGNNPILGVDGQPVSAADWNEQQAQIVDVFKTNDIVVPLTPVFAEANWTWVPGATVGLDPGYWREPSGGGHFIEFPIPGLRQGMKITASKLSLWREIDVETGGSISIVSYPLGVGAAAPGQRAIVFASAIDWDFGVGGSQFGRVDEVPGDIILGEAHYRLQFEAPGTGAGHEVRVYGAMLRVQLGN